jgi:hypothetical protein
MKEQAFEDGEQNKPAATSEAASAQVGWTVFKRARRLKGTERGCRAGIPMMAQVAGATVSCDTRVPGEGVETLERIIKQRAAHEPRPTHAKLATTISALSCDTTSMNSPTTSGHHYRRRHRAPARAAADGRGRPNEDAAQAHRAARIRWRATTGRCSLSSAALKTCLVGLVLTLHLCGLFHDRLDLSYQLAPGQCGTWRSSPSAAVQGSLIIGDSAIEIQEVEDNGNAASQQQQPQQQQQQPQQQQQQQQQPSQQQDMQFEPSSVLLGTTGGTSGTDQLASSAPAQSSSQLDAFGSTQFGGGLTSGANEQQQQQLPKQAAGSEGMSRLPSGPLPPLSKHSEDITDGDRKSRGNHDFELNELTNAADGHDKMALNEVMLGTRRPPDETINGAGDALAAADKTITGKVVDFELQPAGGHNKAKIKKKKKKKKKKEEEMFKKWGKKKKMEKKAMEKEEKKHMKKKKEEGKKGKKKWGHEEHGQKKKGNFKKKK